MGTVCLATRLRVNSYIVLPVVHPYKMPSKLYSKLGFLASEPDMFTEIRFLDDTSTNRATYISITSPH